PVAAGPARVRERRRRGRQERLLQRLLLERLPHHDPAAGAPAPAASHQRLAGMTTIATSVSVVGGPLANAAALDARLAELRSRFPRAIIDRYLELLPSFGERAFVFPGAAVVGDVSLGEDVSVWYGCVLRGDLRPVTVGARTNVQDGTVVHVADDGPCDIGA